jgi:hypothetical protein
MTDDELTRALRATLALQSAERDRLTRDLAERRAREDALLWQVTLRAIRRSQESLQKTLTHSHAAALAACPKG